MSLSAVEDLVKSFNDSESARIALQTTAGHTLRLNCVYKESIAPDFFLLFPPNTIPEDIDKTKNCLISLKDSTDTVRILQAKISDIPNKRSIELTALASIDPLSLREYFRVDIRTHIEISFEGSEGSNVGTWSMKGKTLDLSGSGVLCVVPEQPQSKQPILIEIKLTNKPENIICIGHIVHTKRLRNGNWLTALHFDKIDQKHRDAIITNCFYEQRKQLRERVQTL